MKMCVWSVWPWPLVTLHPYKMETKKQAKTEAQKLKYCEHWSNFAKSWSKIQNSFVHRWRNCFLDENIAVCIFCLCFFLESVEMYESDFSKEQIAKLIIPMAWICD